MNSPKRDRLYRFVGNVPDELEGGRPVAPGEAVEVEDIELPQNKALIDGGKLVRMDKPKPEPVEAIKDNDEKEGKA